ncbi:MAG: 50S ribosomal protein L24 [Firmicutes bacterium ADurb.Bin080]|nr:50S ribosomal protein L24 [Clostridiales bacterium]OQC15602.1 MAG: 50S ribosomal protein L24 [Firmicutes bacterium ADurb.Bin080]
MAKTKLRKDDYIMIISGKDKGKTAQVISVDSDKNRVFVEGNNLASVNTKAVKARKASEQSGLIKRPGSIDISNVLPVCASCGKPTRIGMEVVDGKKVRVCKKCGAVLVTKKAAAKAAAKATVRKKVAVKKSETDLEATNNNTQDVVLAPEGIQEENKTKTTVKTRKKIEKTATDSESNGSAEDK